MIEFEKKITFVIVSYRSINVIENCIRSINKNIKIIIVENSNDSKLKFYLEKKYPNVEVFVSNSNFGYGKANNFGITKVKTQYAFILNPDAYLDQNTLQELSDLENLLKEDFYIIAPNSNEYDNLIKWTNKDFTEVDSVKGFAMLLNLKKINFNEVFDEKIFLFLEEIDLCTRIRNIGGKIYISNKSTVYHLGKKSSENNLSVELCRNWHWMWSLYYYNKKHFGKFTAYKATIYRLLISFIKISLSAIFMRKKSFLVYKYRIHGLLNAYLGKSSWLRPEMIILKRMITENLKDHKYVLRLNKLYHRIFGERFYKKLDFNWSAHPEKYEIIQETILRKKYKNYLEIGCDKDQLFSKINIEKKIGVDPISGGTIRDTSDNFFKNNIIKFDIVFIDGLHGYDQVKNDIENSLKVLNNNGVIFLHDCMPQSYFHQAVPRAQGSWNGDVWKNIVESRTRSEIDTYVILADHGIGMILKRPNRNLLNIDMKNYQNLKYRDYYYNYKNYLNIISADSLKNVF